MHNLQKVLDLVGIFVGGDFDEFRCQKLQEDDRNVRDGESKLGSDIMYMNGEFRL